MGDNRTTVNCNLAGGVVLKLYNVVTSDGPPRRLQDPDAPVVTLKQGDNDIDGEFFNRWREQNERSHLIEEGHLRWPDQAPPKP